MRIRQVLAVIIPIILAGAGIVIASEFGPPASRTGVPTIATKSAESTCIGCHSGNPLNSGATVQLINVPAYYVVGSTYTITVRIASTQTSGNANRVWSFELTAVNMIDGTGAGTFANVAGQGTQIKNGSGQHSTRRYIESNTDRPSATTPVQWQVDWTAPAAGIGPVGFYAAGIAGNGNGSNSGDWVGTASSVMQDPTPTEAVSWGRFKATYR